MNPILVDWNKNIAARMAPFPGLGMGLLASNGHMNYKRWGDMMGHHPASDASWAKVTNGVFELNDDFYHRSGAIYESSLHYEEMFNN